MVVSEYLCYGSGGGIGDIKHLVVVRIVDPSTTLAAGMNVQRVTVVV